MDKLKSELIALLKERSVKFGDFTLASGEQSNFYIDARITTMSAAGLDLIGKLGLAALEAKGWHPDVVGGLTLGADPVSYAVAMASAGRARPIDAFTVRKQPKDHGTGRLIEGSFYEGAAVVVIEDVITSGGSAIKAIETVARAGGKVLGVLAVVDRQAGGVERIATEGHEAVSLVNLHDLGVTPATPPT